MSEENLENGMTNGGDVPEIELIIKDELIFTSQTYEDEREHKVQNSLIINDTEQTATALDSIFITFANEDIPQHVIYSHLDCDVSFDDGDIVQDTKEVLAVSSEAEFNVPYEDNKPCLSPLEPEVHSDTDSVNHMDLASVVAEACEGLFDDIENDLDLNLREELKSNSTAYSCQCVSSAKRTRDSEAMQMAVSAVLNEGLSLGQAAKKYNVVKSTIWSRVSKHPKHRRRKVNQELAEVIHSKLAAGESLSEISRSLNIAKSTVHQHKTRLTKFGMLSPILILKKDRESASCGGTQDRLMQAYRGCRVNGMSVRFAAEFYSVPLTTLWRFIKRNQSAPASEAAASIAQSSNNQQLDKAGADKEDNNVCLMPTNDIKTELNPEDQQLFEDTYLNHLFE